jgi:hypothetical protein
MLRKWPHTVNNDRTEGRFKRGYGPEWSYTNVLIRFPHNAADVTRSTVLGYVSSYIWPVKMGQYPVGGFVNTQVFVIDESWARLRTAFLYSFCTTIWQINAESKDTFLWIMSTITCCIAMAICLVSS